VTCVQAPLSSLSPRPLSSRLCHPVWTKPVCPQQLASYISAMAVSSVILARSSSPLALPSEVWEDGVSPYTCNVANVTFLEAAEPLGNDAFRIYFGGADAVVGTAVVEVSD